MQNLISVICPTYNEENDIERILRFFVNSSPDNKELYIIDGGSKDKTIDIVNKWCQDFDNIFLLENQNRYVSFALNIGVKQSKGDLIIRIDAHTEYATDYFEKIIEVFNYSNADIVGGPMNPIGNSPFQKAVAFCTSCIFGIGDSKIHKINYEGYSDHVYLGAWKRNLFDEIGYFDVRMIRNQDDEFHYRAKSRGKKIFLSPKIKSYYYPRSNIKLLFKQYFQYGLYKPLVLLKIKSEGKLRHLIPSIFFIYILLCPIFIILPILYIPIFLYLLINIYFSFKLTTDINIKILSSVVFFTIHLAYGSGFILGLFNSFIHRRVV